MELKTKPFEGKSPLAVDLVTDLLLEQTGGAFFGVSGAHIESLFYALAQKGAKPILFKHEAQAVAAACGWSQTLNEFAAPPHEREWKLSVVLSTAGGAAFNLIPSLSEAHRSQIPILVIVGTPDLGMTPLAHSAGAFQVTDEFGDPASPQLTRALDSVACHSKVVTRPQDLLVDLQECLNAAKRLRGPAVLIVPSHFWRSREVLTTQPECAQINRQAPSLTSSLIDLEPYLTKPGTVLLLGEDCAQSLSLRPKIRAIAHKYKTPVIVTLRGRGSFFEADPLFCGVAGQISLTATQVQNTLLESKHVVVLGTRLDLLDGPDHRSPLLAHLEWTFIHPYEPHMQTRTLWVPGFVKYDNYGTQTFESPSHPARPVLSHTPQSDTPLSLMDLAPPLSALNWRDLWIDAGNAAAQVAAQVELSADDARIHLALGMGSMGFAIGAGMGSALARGIDPKIGAAPGAQKTIILMGDGSFWMHGLELHTAVQNQIPVLWIIADNHAHAMCILRDIAVETQQGPLPRDSKSFNLFNDYPIASGLKNLFPSLSVREVKTTKEYKQALLELWESSGPAVIVAKLNDPSEVPTAFVPFQNLERTRR